MDWSIFEILITSLTRRCFEIIEDLISQNERNVAWNRRWTGLTVFQPPDMLHCTTGYESTASSWSPFLKRENCKGCVRSSLCCAYIWLVRPSSCREKWCDYLRKTWRWTIQTIITNCLLWLALKTNMSFELFNDTGHVHDITLCNISVVLVCSVLDVILVCIFVCLFVYCFFVTRGPLWFTVAVWI